MADVAPGVSQWCAQETIPLQQWAGGGEWEDILVSGHKWCASQRWHDEWHGRINGCCGAPEERESWACTCICHRGAGEQEG